MGGVKFAQQSGRGVGPRWIAACGLIVGVDGGRGQCDALSDDRSTTADTQIMRTLKGGRAAGRGCTEPALRFLSRKAGQARGLGVVLSAGVVLGCGGCVQVTAPKHPIEINLNINVRQELVVRLKQDAQDFVNSNPELFPQ